MPSLALLWLAAALHAGWNALIKISGDRIAVMAVVTLAGGQMYPHGLRLELLAAFAGKIAHDGNIHASDSRQFHTSWVILANVRYDCRM